MSKLQLNEMSKEQLEALIKRANKKLQTMEADEEPDDSIVALGLTADDFAPKGDTITVLEDEKDDEILTFLGEDDPIISGGEEIGYITKTIHDDPVSKLVPGVAVGRYKPTAFHGNGGFQIWFTNSDGNRDRLTTNTHVMHRLFSGSEVTGEHKHGYVKITNDHYVKLVMEIPVTQTIAMGIIIEWQRLYRALGISGGVPHKCIDAASRKYLVPGIHILSRRKTQFRGLWIPGLPLDEFETNELTGRQHMDGSVMRDDSLNATLKFLDALGKRGALAKREVTK